MVPSRQAGVSTLVELLRLRAEEQPDNWAYSFLADGEDEQIRLGYAELDRRARAIAARLQEWVRPGDRVLLLLPSDLEFVAAFFACLYAGAVAVPAYPPRSQRSLPRLLTIVGDAAPRVALTTSTILSRGGSWTSEAAALRDLRWLAIDDPGAEPLSSLAGRWRDPGADPNRLAFLQYTSGSTAAPKGVMVSHRNLLHNQETIRRAFGQSASSVIVGWLPLFHDMGLIGNVLQPLYVGAPCVLMSPTAFLQKPLRWLQAIDRYRATTSGGPNFAYELCSRKISPEQRTGLDLSCWQVAFNGAEPVRAETLNAFTTTFAPQGFRQEAFYPCYGLAEATLFVSGGEAGQGPALGRFAAASLAEGRGEEAGGAEAERLLVGCGRAWMEQRIAIADPETGTELPPGWVGEIWVAGPSVTAGYWNRPEETARDFGVRLSGSAAAEDGFLRTGDLGFLSGGQLFIAGRRKDLILLRGRNHYPQDFEATAEASHPDLLPGGVAAFSVEAEGEERLVILAEVNRRREAAVDAAAVALALRQAIAEIYEVRVHEVVLIRAGTLLKTSSGKVRRQACREAWEAGDLAAVGRSRGGEGGGEPDEIAVDWTPAEILGLPSDRRRPALISWLRLAAAAACGAAPASFSTQIPLTSQGLDSLASATLQQQVEVGFGVELAVAELLDGASVARLAGRILDAPATAGGARAPQEAAPPDGFALTVGQQALWFLDRLAPASALHNLAAAARIQGELDPAALGLAVAELTARHPALRTRFSAAGGPPQQRIEPALAPDFEVLDAAVWSRRELAERLDEEARRPFDLERGSPARWHLFVRSPRESTLLLTIHHLVADFWSVVVLMRDLEALYLRRPAPSLPPLAATYADYVRWQESRLSGTAGERLWSFWESQLTLPLPVLDLPVDRPRAPVQSFRGASETIVIEAGVLADLNRLARAHDATPFMVLLGLFQVLLHRASGQEDILVGTPTGGRGPAAFADLVGYFVNPIVLRAGFTDDPPFGEHLASARTRILAAYAHQEYPFAGIAERLPFERDPSRPPLFQAMFTLQKAQRPELERLAGFALGEGGERLDWAGLDLESLRLGWRPVAVDLALAVAETGGSLRCSLQYCADLFDAVTARRLLERFAALANAVAAAAERRVGSLPWLSEGEQAQIRAEWNDTATAAPAEELVHRQVERAARLTPGRVALICRGESLTYGELDARANRMARHLLALGLRPEGRVGVCLDRSPDMAVALLGVLKAGGAYVPLDPAYPRERLALILEDAGIDLLVAEERRAAAFGSRVRVVRPDADREAIGRRRDGALPRAADLAGSLAYLIYTSGSTGRPKGVMVGHRNVANFFAAMDRILGDEPGCWLATTSISFDISVLELLWTLSRGYRVVLRASGSRPAPASRPQSERAVDFSLFYFASDAGSGERGRSKYRLLLEAAKRADRLGFSAVWTPERHFHAFGGLYPNPSVTGAALAAITERVAIRAGSVVLPLHNPVRVAEEWSVVDNLSDGRVGIAFASGWNAADFVFAPERFAARKEVMLEQIEVVRRLWRGEAVRMPGGAGEVEVRILPRPVQAELPVWLTAAGSPDTFRLAGELGANLLTHLLGQRPRDVEEKIAVYRRAWRAAGHPGEGRVALMLHTFVGESGERVRETVREPLIQYLATSLDLMKVLAPEQDFSALSAGDQRALLERAFDRYFETSGLFGTPESCLERVRELAAIGVDEIACLIDFGVETDRVLESLEPLAALREASRPAAGARADAEETIPAQIARQEVTHFQCTPSALTAIALDPGTPAAFSRLRRLLLGGEALPQALAERAAGWLSGELLNMYGPTETTVWSAVDRVDGRSAVTIGRPIANTELHVGDRRLEPVPVGRPGELLIGGEGVVRGYWGRPELTAERFIPDPFAGRPGARLYRTGDQVRRQSDGRIVFLGRLDHQVKIRGHRIELGEIEAALARHPDVRAAAAVLWRSASGEPHLVAYTVPAQGGAPAVRELRDYLAARLPEAMVPSFFVALDALPQTPNGKVDRGALPPPDPGTAAEPVAPRTPTEELLLTIWAEVLGLERPGVHDSFFDLGGHSLLATRIASRIRQLFGVELPLQRLFELPTAHRLARFIDAAIRGGHGGGEGAESPLGPAPRPRELPLSYGQERLWFLHRLAPASPVLNISHAFRLSGRLDAGVLAASLEEICRRHEILRTRVYEIDGTPRQEVLEPSRQPLPVVDLGGLPAPDRELRRLADAVAHLPVDPSAGRLLRTLLLRSGERDQVLLLTVHHLASDGWSLEILLRELSELYEARLQGRSPRLPAPALQYADYALWQRRWLSGEAIEPQLSFWRRQLAAPPAAPVLPGQRERRAIPRFRGGVHRFALSSAVSAALRQLARAEASTLFMTLLAAFSALLHQYTGQEDLLVGTNVANRNREEVEGLMGFVLNNLALRADLSGDPTFRQLLARLREMTLASYAHQDVPFEQVVAAVQPQRDGSYAPLFKVMFVMQSFLPSLLRLPGLETAPYELGHQTANFDLMVLMAEGADGLLGAFLFDSDLFEAAAVARMATHFAGVLASVARDADQTLSGLDVGGDAAAVRFADQFNEGPAL